MLLLITGYPNSGKTTIMKELKNVYQNIFIADEYIQKIYQPNEIGYLAIQTNFGNNYVNANGVDKQSLGNLILQNPEANKKLRMCIWPLLREKLLELKNSKKNYLVEMAIYLVDNDHFFENLFDYVIEIVADFEVANEKQKFHQLYDRTPNHVDQTIRNKDLKTAVIETQKLVVEIFGS